LLLESNHATNAQAQRRQTGALIDGQNATEVALHERSKREAAQRVKQRVRDAEPIPVPTLHSSINARSFACAIVQHASFVSPTQGCEGRVIGDQFPDKLEKREMNNNRANDRKTKEGREGESDRATEGRKRVPKQMISLLPPGEYWCSV